MPELTERQRTILQLLIRDYIETAQPVGSKRLVERFHLDLSPATVRNEMSALTEMGYYDNPTPRRDVFPLKMDIELLSER